MSADGLFEWAREYHARIDDPDTSFIAQLLLEEETVQAMLRMDLLAHGKIPLGLTDEEVKVVLGQLWPGVRIHDRDHYLDRYPPRGSIFADLCDHNRIVTAVERNRPRP